MRLFNVVHFLVTKARSCARVWWDFYGAQDHFRPDTLPDVNSDRTADSGTRIQIRWVNDQRLSPAMWSETKKSVSVLVLVLNAVVLVLHVWCRVVVGLDHNKKLS